MKLDAGKLRHRVRVQKPSRSADAQGNPVIGWENETNAGIDGIRWASLEPLRSRELFLAAQAAVRSTHRMRMRWFTGLTTQHRVAMVDDGRVFNLDSVINVDDTDSEYELLVSESP